MKPPTLGRVACGRVCLISSQDARGISFHNAFIIPRNEGPALLQSDPSQAQDDSGFASQVFEP